MLVTQRTLAVNQVDIPLVRLSGQRRVVVSVNGARKDDIVTQVEAVFGLRVRDINLGYVWRVRTTVETGFGPVEVIGRGVGHGHTVAPRLPGVQANIAVLVKVGEFHFGGLDTGLGIGASKVGVVVDDGTVTLHDKLSKALVLVRQGSRRRVLEHFVVDTDFSGETVAVAKSRQVDFRRSKRAETVAVGDTTNAQETAVKGTSLADRRVHFDRSKVAVARVADVGELVDVHDRVPSVGQVSDLDTGLVLGVALVTSQDDETTSVTTANGANSGVTVRQGGVAVGGNDTPKDTVARALDTVAEHPKVAVGSDFESDGLVELAAQMLHGNVFPPDRVGAQVEVDGPVLDKVPWNTLNFAADKVTDKETVFEFVGKALGSESTGNDGRALAIVVPAVDIVRVVEGRNRSLDLGIFGGRIADVKLLADRVVPVAGSIDDKVRRFLGAFPARPAQVGTLGDKGQRLPGVPADDTTEQFRGVGVGDKFTAPGLTEALCPDTGPGCSRITVEVGVVGQAVAVFIETQDGSRQKVGVHGTKPVVADVGRPVDTFKRSTVADRDPQCAVGAKLDPVDTVGNANHGLREQINDVSFVHWTKTIVPTSKTYRAVVAPPDALALGAVANQDDLRGRIDNVALHRETRQTVKFRTWKGAMG